MGRSYGGCAASPTPPRTGSRSGGTTATRSPPATTPGTAREQSVGRADPSSRARIRNSPGREECDMTATEQRPAGVQPGQIVEMSWDPITRIIGNLGIYTKIDFANQRVTECHSTSSLFRGYSV